jgi:hypothetical protein
MFEVFMAVKIQVEVFQVVTYIASQPRRPQFEVTLMLK